MGAPGAERGLPGQFWPPRILTRDPKPEAEPGVEEQQLVIVTGMSGAGRSRALSALEDFGYFCIDNLPPTMIPQVSELITLENSQIRRMGVACDVRGGELFDKLVETLDNPEAIAVPHYVMFLDADDDALINRFKETRRPHPLADQYPSLSAAIARERQLLQPIRERADMIIDTSELRASELRARIQTEFHEASLVKTLSVAVSSFGFKYGQPGDADIVFDVRFLPNPYYDPDLKPLSGLDEPVRTYVLGRKETQRFFKRWFPMLESVLPSYAAEGKLHLSVALGCTGGRHRSVAIAEATGAWLREKGYRVTVTHRDLDKDANH